MKLLYEKTIQTLITSYSNISFPDDLYPIVLQFLAYSEADLDKGDASFNPVQHSTYKIGYDTMWYAIPFQTRDTNKYNMLVGACSACNLIMVKLILTYTHKWDEIRRTYIQSREMFNFTNEYDETREKILELLFQHDIYPFDRFPDWHKYPQLVSDALRKLVFKKAIIDDDITALSLGEMPQIAYYTNNGDLIANLEESIEPLEALQALIANPKNQAHGYHAYTASTIAGLLDQTRGNGIYPGMHEEMIKHILEYSTKYLITNCFGILLREVPENNATDMIIYLIENVNPELFTEQNKYDFRSIFFDYRNDIDQEQCRQKLREMNNQYLLDILDSVNDPNI